MASAAGITASSEEPSRRRSAPSRCSPPPSRSRDAPRTRHADRHRPVRRRARRDQLDRLTAELGTVTSNLKPPQAPDDHLPPALATYSATAWISLSVSCPANAGIPPPPARTFCWTRRASGCTSSRFGPTVPEALASASVWQELQRWVKIFRPSTEVPRVVGSSCGEAGSLPSLPQPPSASALRPAARMPEKRRPRILATIAQLRHASPGAFELAALGLRSRLPLSSPTPVGLRAREPPPRHRSEGK